MKNFLGFKERKVLVNISNSNFCILAWMLASAKSITKIENLHKRALTFIFDDNSNSTVRILEKSGKYFMDVKRKDKLCIEIYKILSNLNHSFMNKIFELRLWPRPVREKYKLNFSIP